MSKLDDLLSKWPLPERSQLEADEAAERVVAAVRAGQMPGSIDETLLAAPLPQTKDDNASRPGIAGPSIAVENKMSKDRTRDRTSFQELAKMATTPPPPTTSVIPSAPIPPSASSSGSSGVVRGKEADASDSGIVDLKAIANADPSGSQRAQSTPLAEQGLFDDDSAPAKPAVSAAAAQAHLSEAPSAPGSAKAALSTPPKADKEEKKGGGVVIVLGALVAAAAIAAGGFFFVKYQRTHNAQVATTTSTPDKAGQPAAAKAGATAGAIGSVAVADQQDDTVEIVTPGQPGVKPTFKFHGKAGSGGAGGAATADPNGGSGAGGVDPKLIANVPTGPAGGGSGDLAEAMKAAAGGGSAMAGTPVTGGGTESKYAAGTVPQRPSQGSVAGGIGSVMPTVKACLGSDDPISRASITFQSDGTVKSVTVSGFAAGKPQESCIKAALMKANVGPFAEATYQVTQPIRPN